MASPAYRSSSKTAQLTVGSTSVTVTEPTGAANGDGLLYCLMIDRSSGSNPGTVSPPTGGWTIVPGFPVNATGVFDVYVWYLIRGGSAPGYQATWTNALGGFGYSEVRAIATSGIVGTGSFIDTQAIGSVTTTTQPDPPSITTNTIETLVYAFAYSWAGWTSAPTPPTNYTNVTDNGSLYDSSIAYRAIATATTENPGTFGAADASDTGVGLTIALASVAAGPTGPTIDTQPQSQTKFTGDTATFTVSATTSGGTLHYQWKVNGGNVGTDQDNYTTSALTFANNGDIITVAVTDDNGTTNSSNALLTIIYSAGVAWFAM